MIGSWWMWLTGGVVIGGMRWTEVDFMLDRFGTRCLDSPPSTRAPGERAIVQRPDEVTIWVRETARADRSGVATDGPRCETGHG